MQRAVHSRFFRSIYRDSPCSDIEGRIVICICNIATIFTTKVFPFSDTDMHATITSLRSIGRWNSNKFNAIKQRLIGQELSELVKTPAVQLCLLCLSLWFSCFANVGQVFNGNAFIFSFCLLNYLLAYRVVIDGNEPTLFAGKPFQQPFAVFCAFALNAGSYFRVFFTNLFKLVGIIIGAVRKYGNIGLTKINPNKFFNIPNIAIGYLNRLKQVEFSLSVNQISFAFNIWKVLRVMADKRDLQATTGRPDGNNISRSVGKNPAVIRNATKRPEYSFGFPVNLVTIRYFAYTAYDYLGTKTVIFRFDPMVRFPVKFELLKNLALPSYARNFVASSIRFFQCIQKQIRLFIGWQKLYFQRQFHTQFYVKFISMFQLQESFIINSKTERHFLPMLKQGVSVPEFS